MKSQEEIELSTIWRQLKFETIKLVIKCNRLKLETAEEKKRQKGYNMKNKKNSNMESSEEFPEILYKYRSLSGQSFEYTRDIFLRNELYFPHPEQINDPFDCRNPLSFDNITKEKLIAHFEKHESRFGINLSCEKQAVISNPLETTIEALKKHIAKGSRQDVGVLSLSSEKLNILMWSHYADSHTGICIGFDRTKLIFSFNGIPFTTFKVAYPVSNHYPYFHYLEVEMNIEAYYSTKAYNWEYENEWRIVLPENGRTSKKFSPDALVSVHLGCLIAKKHKSDVISWCSQRNVKPEIFETNKDESSYSIKETEISY